MYIVYTAIGDFETFIYLFPPGGEILRPTSAKVGAGPPLSSTHYGPQRPCSAEEENRSAAAGMSAYGLVTRLAGVIRLLYAGRAVKEEPQAADAADKGVWYARQSRQKPPQTRILYAPIPGGVMNGQAPSFVASAVLCAAP